eukprot:gene1060-2481_t
MPQYASSPLPSGDSFPRRGDRPGRRAMPGSRFIIPAELSRDDGEEGWGKPAFTGCTREWLLQNRDVRNLDPSGTVAAVVRNYMQSAQEKFSVANMDCWYRFLFRKACGAPVACTPSITLLQITGLMCLIGVKLLRADQQGAISEFLGHCLGKFSASTVQRAEQAASRPLAEEPPPLGEGGDAAAGGDGGRRSTSPLHRPPALPAAAPAAAERERRPTPSRPRSPSVEDHLTKLAMQNASLHDVMARIASTMDDMKRDFSGRISELERARATPPAAPPVAARAAPPVASR